MTCTRRHVTDASAAFSAALANVIRGEPVRQSVVQGKIMVVTSPERFSTPHPDQSGSPYNPGTSASRWINGADAPYVRDATVGLTPIPTNPRDPHSDSVAGEPACCLADRCRRMQ